MEKFVKSRAIISAFIIVALSANLYGESIQQKKRVNTTQIKQDSPQIKKSNTNKKTTTKAKSTPKNKKIKPVESGISRTTIITLSTLGGVALASGIGVGAYYGITTSKNKDSKSPNQSSINIGMADSGYNRTAIPQSSKNFYDLGVSPPNTNYVSHGTMVAQSIRAHNTTSNLYMYTAGCQGDKICVDSNMYNALYARDVKVINASWGNMVDKDLLSISAQQFSRYGNTPYYDMAREVASGRRIFVFAAGNESSRHSSLQSNLPLISTKLPNISNRDIWDNVKKGWIAVTATNSKNILDTNYANWIGEEAKNWGIAVKPHFIGQGTSFAAPVVSAVVANVWNKFPWMDNHLVTQTILSTADKYTISGSDDYYGGEDKWHYDVVTDNPNKKTGWGILNESRALNGPSRFDRRLLVPSDNGKVQIHLSRQHYGNLANATFSNDIVGDAGLHKYGDGTLILSGDNAFSGDTQIDEGKIVLTNALRNSKVTINTNGTLQTQKTSDSQIQSVILGANQGYSITNYGHFEVLKDTTLNGDYISGGNATLGLDIDAKLNVQGSVDMSGGALAFRANNAIPSTNLQTKTLLTAQNGIKNLSQNISQDSSAFLQVSEVKLSTDNDLQVRYKRDSTNAVISKAMGYTPQNLQNIGCGIDSVLDNLAESSEYSAQDSNIYTETLSLIATPLQNVVATISSLSGEIYDSNLSILHKSSMLLNRTIARRLYQIQDSKSSGAWADISYSKSTLSQNGFAEGKISQYAGIAGIDDIYNANAITFGVGVLFSVDRAKGDFGVGGKSDILSYGASLYTLISSQNLYTLLRFGTNLHDTSVTRKLHFGSGATLQNKQKDLSYHGYVELGYHIDIGFFRITPFVAWEEDFIMRKKVQENGIDNNGSHFALTLEATKYRVSSLIYGAKGFLRFDTFKLEYSALNAFAPKPNPFNSNASFVGANSVRFTSSGIPQTKNLTFISLGVSYDFGNLILRGEYSISLNPTANKQIEDRIINLNLRYGF